MDSETGSLVQGPVRHHLARDRRWASQTTLDPLPLLRCCQGLSTRRLSKEFSHEPSVRTRSTMRDEGVPFAHHLPLTTATPARPDYVQAIPQSTSRRKTPQPAYGRTGAFSFVSVFRVRRWRVATAARRRWPRHPHRRPAQLPAQLPAQRPAELLAQRSARRPAQLPGQRPARPPGQ